MIGLELGMYQKTVLQFSEAGLKLSAFIVVENRSRIQVYAERISNSLSIGEMEEFHSKWQGEVTLWNWIMESLALLYRFSGECEPSLARS